MARPEKRYEFHKDGKIVARGTIKQLSKRLNIPLFRMRNWNKMEVRESYKKGIARQCLVVDSGKERTFMFYRGEEVLAEGTIDEIAQKTGLSRRTIEWYRYPSAKKRHKRTSLIEVERDDF